MATVVMMIAGAVVNAAAFTGGNYLFSMLNKQDADQERIRHDKALENYQSAQADYSKKRLERLDYLNDRIRAESHAEKTFQDIESAMHEYYIITGGNNPNLPPLDEPDFKEYYEPSDNQKKYELLFMSGSLLLTGITAFRLI